MNISQYILLSLRERMSEGQVRETGVIKNKSYKE